MKNKYTVKRVGKPSPYVDWALRCQYAVEAVEAITAPADAQILMLKLSYGVDKLSEL